MKQSSNLSSPLSTGGYGHLFEAQVQASIVTLMLTGGHAPYMPWPIEKIKLQGRFEEFETDDLIILVDDPKSNGNRKMLAQIKSKITITKKDLELSKVLRAAWNDFNNPKIYTKGIDQIALITGPMNATDTQALPWILKQARAASTPQDFFRRINTDNFSSNASREKLKVIRQHLKVANDDIELHDEQFHDFLKHYRVLMYDFGDESGVVHSLLSSLISLFASPESSLVWGRIVEFVQFQNSYAGVITRDSLPRDIRVALEPNVVTQVLPIKNNAQQRSIAESLSASDAAVLALLTLVGTWHSSFAHDIEAVCSLLEITTEKYFDTIRRLRVLPATPLLKSGDFWCVSNRVDLWRQLAYFLLENDLMRFIDLVKRVFQPAQPHSSRVFTQPIAITRSFDGTGFSLAFRQNVIDGLALLATHADACMNSSLAVVESLTASVVSELLHSADANQWARLNPFLPQLAEASPDAFLNAVEEALRASPSPFAVLLRQEGKQPLGPSYLSGLLWGVEGLAWSEEFFMRICLILGELASHDPGGKWANRPANSLTTIIWPWWPQTLASASKRLRAVEQLMTEFPDVAWQLLISLIPGAILRTSGTHKPRWRRLVDDDWKPPVSQQEYQEQIDAIGQMAVRLAQQNPQRMGILIARCDNLSEQAFDNLLECLHSETTISLPEEQRLSIWDSLNKVIRRHRRHPDAGWARPIEWINRLVECTEKLMPLDPVHRYRFLFTSDEFDLRDDTADKWDLQQDLLRKRREEAVEVIVKTHGIMSIFSFSAKVERPDAVGMSLGRSIFSDDFVDHFPTILDSDLKSNADLIGGYIWSRTQALGPAWCDSLSTQTWTTKQTGTFLSYLPFTPETWKRVSQWLRTDEQEYWALANPNLFFASDRLDFAASKLLEHNRPIEAIVCLERMREPEIAHNVKLCLRALLAAAGNTKDFGQIQKYPILALIKLLQENPAVNEDERLVLEWSWLPLLDRDEGAAPVTMEHKLASDPEFFHELITKAFRSTYDNPDKVDSDDSCSQAHHVWHLLHEWRTVPGTQPDGSFDGASFTKWLGRVTELCEQTGHFAVGLLRVGEVLTHASPDSDGLWIHRAVATALNDRRADCLRRGYRTGLYNSRGAHFVDPSGAQERDLAAKYRTKAEAVESAGFVRLAVTLRDLARDYDTESTQWKSDH